MMMTVKICCDKCSAVIEHKNKDEMFEIWYRNDFDHKTRLHLCEKCENDLKAWINGEKNDKNV